MAERETTIDTIGDNSNSVLVAIAVLVVLAIGAYLLFFGLPATSPGNAVTIEVPIAAPATPAPAN